MKNIYIVMSHGRGMYPDYGDAYDETISICLTLEKAINVINAIDACNYNCADIVRQINDAGFFRGNDTEAGQWYPGKEYCYRLRWRYSTIEKALA